LKRNVLNLYTGLVRIYDPGDQIYLFGFSRGAFTVRTLAGMIARCGILKWEDLRTTDAMNAAVAEAYNTYRESYRTWLWRMLHFKSEEAVRVAAEQEMKNFREVSKAHTPNIRFIGVWDTVDSVGGPFHISDIINTFFHRFKFPDHKLSDKIERAAQALSIDDARAEFEPQLWEDNGKVEQVWFAGVHSNVGGGYPKQGMSLVTLDWMIQKAAENELRILDDDRKLYWEHGSVDDKLYNSRAGLGVFYRWWPRYMQKLCEKQRAAYPPKIHLSVLERIAHGTDGYAPGTLAPHMDVVYTPSGDTWQDEATKVRVEAVNQALKKVLANGSANDKVRGTLVVGLIAYYFYLAACFAVIVAAAILKEPGSLNPWTVLKNAFSLVSDAVTAQWSPLLDAAKRLLQNSNLLLILVIAFAISGLLAYYVRQARSQAFSRYWHDARHELREALKAARQSMEKRPQRPPGAGS
jgi:Uncharacterized alpha/beta hydrolase domain (DUF2235)